MISFGAGGAGAVFAAEYLLPAGAGAACLFRPKTRQVEVTSQPLTVIPPVATATLSVLLFFFVDQINALAKLVVVGPWMSRKQVCSGLAVHDGPAGAGAAACRSGIHPPPAWRGGGGGFSLFPALFGFAAFLFIVQVGKWLRMMIMMRIIIMTDPMIFSISPVGHPD